MINSRNLVFGPLLASLVACSSGNTPKIQGLSGSEEAATTAANAASTEAGGNGSGSGSSAENAGPTGPAPLPSTIANLQALTPAQLGEKIYAAIGPGMTLMTPGKNGAPASGSDYLVTNASNFVGQVASDPTAKYASSFSIGYFMALAGFANVVGANYSAALTAKGATPPTNDCREEAGAEAILQAVAPTITAADSKTIGATLVTACTADPGSALSAVVQSYSMAINN